VDEILRRVQSPHDKASPGRYGTLPLWVEVGVVNGPVVTWIERLNELKTLQTLDVTSFDIYFETYFEPRKRIAWPV
jgi:hypothetical protein